MWDSLKRTGLVLLPLSMAACGGGSGDGQATGELSMGVTDAPVDSATNVHVAVTGIELKPKEGERILIPYDGEPIDLLAQQGTMREMLFADEVVPAGEYAWMRLLIAEGESSIKLPDGDHSLVIPSGAETGLKINTPFSIVANASHDYTLDFDLRKSIADPEGGDYLLRPTLRLVDTEAAASVSGTVEATLLAAEGCSNGEDGYAVYAFEGHGVAPDDMDGIEPDPVTSAAVESTESGEYQYEVGYLPAGEYTLALTCNAHEDAPDTDDALVFPTTLDVSVQTGQTATADLSGQLTTADL